MKRIILEFNEKDFFKETAPSITKLYEFNSLYFSKLINDIKLLKEKYADSYFAIKNLRSNVIEDCNIIIENEKTHIISQSLIIIDDKNIIKASLKNSLVTFKTFAFTYDKNEEKLYIVDLKNEKKEITIEKNGSKKVIEWRNNHEQSIKVLSYDKNSHLSKNQNKIEIGGNGVYLIEKILFEGDIIKLTIKNSQIREVTIENNLIKNYILNQSRITKLIESFYAFSGIDNDSFSLFNELIKIKNLDTLNSKLFEIRDINLLFDDNNKLNILNEIDIFNEIKKVMDATLEISQEDRKKFIELTKKLNDSFKNKESIISNIELDYFKNIFIEESNLEVDLNCLNNLVEIEKLINPINKNKLIQKNKLKL